ncbi:MAG: MBL fold metallo-hydrolase [Phycisphaerae bacterium]
MKAHGGVTIETFVEPMFSQNAYIVSHHAAGECWIVDPGFPPQAMQIRSAVQRRGLTPIAIVLTHGHPDHIAGVAALKEAYPGAAIVCPREEERMLHDPEANLSAMMGMAITTPPADRLVAVGDALELGASRWQALDVAGHSPGGLAYYCAAAKLALVGDALFFGSIGRYDFPGSDRGRLLRNIVNNLLTLPDDTAVYSGHGPATTIGHERKHNLTLRWELQQDLE